MSVSGALAALATVLQAAATASALGGVRATAVHATPPEAVPVFPALVHAWDGSRFDQFPGGSPSGFQREFATIEALLLTREPTVARAHATVLAVVAAYRTVVAANQSLAGTVRQVRLTGARPDEIEYGGTSYHGAAITLEAELHHGTTWAE